MAQKVHCAAASPCAAQLPPKACHFAAAFFEAGRFGMASAASGLRHPASASCLGRHSRLAGRCPNNSSLFPPLAAVVVVASHIQRKEYFLICSSGKSADFPELPFHGWGRKGRWHICPFPCALLCESQIQKRPQAFLHKNKNRGTQVVKLSVPFLFSLRRLWYQTQPVPRRKLQSKPCCRFP